LGPKATFHLWVVNEIFSCADGSVQFIELVTTFNGQEFLNGHQLQATNSNGSQTHSFIFPGNSGSPTANKSLLIATAGFGSLPGGITADFTISDNFLFTEGGSISLVGADTLTYNTGKLPLDGISSLARSGGTSANSPRNFAGQQGSVSCPLVIRKTGPTTVVSGELITYTLTVTGSGSFNNTNVMLTDTIPSGTSFAWAEVTPINGVLTWPLGDMPAPLSVINRTFVVTVDAPAGSVIINSDYGVESDQTNARGLAFQVPVITGSGSAGLIYLPVIFKNVDLVGEHDADLSLGAP
jgi:uncharacterized repeat protein (TIGR01451 family)